jgi:hypothetical protein
MDDESPANSDNLDMTENTLDAPALIASIQRRGAGSMEAGHVNTAVLVAPGVALVRPPVDPELYAMRDAGSAAGYFLVAGPPEVTESSLFQAPVSWLCPADEADSTADGLVAIGLDLAGWDTSAVDVPGGRDVQPGSIRAATYGLEQVAEAYAVLGAAEDPDLAWFKRVDEILPPTVQPTLLRGPTPGGRDPGDVEPGDDLDGPARRLFPTGPLVPLRWQCCWPLHCDK